MRASVRMPQRQPDSFAANCTQKESLMTTFRSRTACTMVCVGVLASLAMATAQAGDCESGRILQYYERCYGPNGPYCIACDRCCRNAQACDTSCCCCCRNIYSFFGPGSCPPSRFWDICAYRVCFLCSPWYSHPRDGIHYPAYGSKSPSCVPANSY